jgi:SAM-dependent methyltransferase
MDLRESWETHASDWIAWARAPSHDSYWRFHREQFFSLLPPPGKLTLDIGCGEGRVARDLKRLGHQVIGIDASPSMLAAAREADLKMDLRLADAAALPLADASADLVIAFMSLQDIDAMEQAVREVARVLEPKGAFCLAIVHPLNSAGRFEERAADARFIIEGSYLEPHPRIDTIERDGLQMTFTSRHRPLSAYFAALQAAGFVIEALREPALPEHALSSEVSLRWQRIPLFLHLRARRL